MAWVNNFICLFALLVAFNIIWAQEGSGEMCEDEEKFNFPSGSVPNLNSIFGGSQEDHVPIETDSEDTSTEGQVSDRLFFGLFGTPQACNFTTQPGSTCAGCREVLRCFSNNRGILNVCKFPFPYCNNGRCSIFRGSACTTTTVAATTTTVAATTTA